jgi:serine/threonine protein kinase
MAETTEKVQEVLAAAAKLTGDERRRYLDEVCVGDDRVRREVESLLAALDHAPSDLETAAVRFAHKPLSGEHAGDVIGRYKLLQVIGEGGFGTVYMAEQAHPVRRNVALKIIKLGMDTR